MKVVTFLLIFSLALQALAANPLIVAEDRYFDPAFMPRVGIEIELTGLSLEELAPIIQKKIGGVIQVYKKEEWDFDPATKKPLRYYVVGKQIEKSLLGALIIKPEDNGTSNDNLKEAYQKTQVVEIVTEPLNYAQVEVLQKAMDAIKEAGALGTSRVSSVSIQINVEMGEGLRENILVNDILTILRGYLHPDPRKDIGFHFKVPKHRQKYLGLFSDGMMERLMDPLYHPSWEKFFEDFMYRQSLEILGFAKAWSFSPKRARRLLRREVEAKGFEVLLPVMKWNYIRVSSLMMFMFPKDWLTQYLLETDWFKDHPILEFREPNNDFRVNSKVRKITGHVIRSTHEGVVALKGLGFRKGVLPIFKVSRPSCQRIMLNL
ncbi:MAG: amidoligase family protein [Bdellovibrionales bacterium]|nr:amidoligase family protein [Bdellovibrionales bacterium]